MSSSRRNSLAMWCIGVTTAAFSFDAMAQEAPTRVVYAVPPPVMGESNNPNRDIAANDEFQVKPMYENLIGVDPETSEWVPMLAESWELNEAGDQLTFELREGVQFHNDFGEFTAEDVVFSLDDWINPPGAFLGGGDTLRRTIDRFEIVDDHTLILHISEEGVGLPFFEVISYGAAGTAIKSKADWESRGGGKPATPPMDEAPIAGTGPYQFLERTPGTNVVFAKVPYDHWRKNAEFEEMEYRFIQENATRLSALLAGEAHITVLPSELAAEAVDRGMEIIRSSLPGVRTGMFFEGCYYAEPVDAIDPDRPSAEIFTSGERLYPDSPWCDRDIRIAANKAIDRQAIIDAFYEGNAEVSYQWFHLPEAAESWNPEWEERWDEHLGYDPEGAREILEAHGEPVDIQVYVKDDVSEAVGNMLQDVGFNVEFVTVDEAQFWAQRESHQFRAMLEHDNVGSEIITSFEPHGYGNQDSGREVQMVELDTMYENVLSEIDTDRRNEMWREFGDILFDEALFITLVRAYAEFVVNPDVVCGYSNPGANMTDPYAFVETIEKCE